MNLRSQLPLFIAILVIFAGVGAAIAQDPVQVPEGVTPDSDWAYRHHFEQVQGIMQEANTSVRLQKLENFTKKLHPEAKMLPYMESYFLQTADELTKAGKAQEAEAVMAKVAELFPGSLTVKNQQFMTAFQNKDYPKAIQLGEELNAANPDPQMDVMLAQAYMATNNGPKAAEYSQKILDAAGPKEGAFFLLWLAEYYNGQKDTAKAMQYYDQFLQAFPEDQPPQGWAADVWSRHKGTAYALRANHANTQKDCAGAEQNFNQSLKFLPKNDVAYLVIGLCQWRAQELDKAEISFARAVAINGPGSAKAREYLEQIWKPRHNDTTDGLDEFVAKVKADSNL
jgi:tetratricopeptide (TPR) repeat protein